MKWWQDILSGWQQYRWRRQLKKLIKMYNTDLSKTLK
jgi:hypothetical protein